jgi:hypothetical protein
MARAPYYLSIKDPVLREQARQEYQRFCRWLVIVTVVAFPVILGLDWLHIHVGLWVPWGH